MLDIAIKYEDKLKELWNNTWFDDKYKFFHFGSHFEQLKLKEDTWNAHEFVSVSKTGEVIGLIFYEVNRDTRICGGLGIINFMPDNSFSMEFGLDVKQAIDDIFVRYKFNKLNFSVAVGNPAERHYDRLINKCGGRIVGVWSNETKLMDGEFYDVKSYEISKEAYLKSRR